MSPFDLLPDEVMEMVLAAVPAASSCEKDKKWNLLDLLSLRLVCRRWSRLVLSSVVWRHRKLSVGNEEQLGLLRLVPALDTLSASVGVGSTEGMWRALADSTCKVRSLRCDISTTAATSSLAGKILEDRRATLRSLSLSIRCPPTESSSALLTALDQPSQLKTLSLYVVQCSLNHKFRRLKSLKRLTCNRWPLPPSCKEIKRTTKTLRKLVVANKRTLRTVHCSHFDLLRQLAQCKRLRYASVAPCSGLPALLERPKLKGLRVNCCRAGDLIRLDKALRRASGLRRVHVVVCCRNTSKFVLPSVVDGLDRVRTLELCLTAPLGTSFRVSDLLRVFAATSNVQVLVLNWVGVPSATFVELLRAWRSTTLPNLRVVRANFTASSSMGDWARALNARRPHLDIEDCCSLRQYHIC